MQRIDLPRPAEAYDRVVEMIGSGRFLPGAQLTEEGIAADLGVSRAPVRQALAKLVGQGVLVGGGRGQGVRMRDYTAEETRQLYEYREALEGIAASAAARMATPVDLARLESICAAEAAELPEPDPARWVELDALFHKSVGKASHNERVAVQLQLLVDECRALFFVLPQLSRGIMGIDLDGVVANHERLLGLIRDREPNAAEQEARRVMRESSQRAIELTLARKLPPANLTPASEAPGLGRDRVHSQRE
ncbi:MAG: GntR family transcriptional regulator [Patescibacteria group bacterium]|nr:GntR family transcriptional regulator [Patescibacteria group bacterium]